MHPRWIIFLLLLPLLALPAQAADTIPPSPTPHYIVDDAHVLAPSTLQAIDQQLQQVERDTSNQIVVGVYPKMQSNDDIAAYAVRVFQAWGVGQKDKNNGVVLLVFIDDRKMNITTGYGLEGALPDATCKQIIENEIKPHFKTGDYDGGIRAGVTAILAATRGEYKGTGHTGLDYTTMVVPGLFIGLIVLLVFAGMISAIFGTTYSSQGRVPSWVIPFILLSNMTSSRSGGGWSGGGGGWSGGGGGFSGGGGSTGGGGASGSW
jgi:uncharacterized protein